MKMTNAAKLLMASFLVASLMGCGSGGGGGMTGTITPLDRAAPSQPTGLTAIATGSSSINLNWTASTDDAGVAGYKIFRGGLQVGTSVTATYTDTALAASTTYAYTVSAYDKAGNNSARSTSASATTLAAGPPDTVAPSAPTNLTATAASASQINLAWTAAVDNVGVAGYEVWRDNVKITTTAATVYNSTGLSSNTNYSYFVTAYDAAGNLSAPSGSASATTLVAAVPAADPLYGDQWHLKNSGNAGEDVNVEPAWAACGTGSTCRGEGVLIAVVDEDLEIAHEDLEANIAAGLSHNYVTGSADPSSAPTDTISGHGTMVAGIAGARDLNGLGVRGVAPRASLAGYNFLQNSTASNEADAMTRNATAVGVNTNSWGAQDGRGTLAPSTLAWRSAVNTGLTTGRGGLGIVYTFAAGNGATGSQACPVCEDNSNYDGLANYRGVMAVGAVTDQGVKASYSERGANLWVSAPGGEFCNTHTISTTDRSGGLGINTATTGGITDYGDTNYTKCMNGTSAATPAVAGVAALVEQANPNLGWRDVRMILAASARKNDPADPEWAVNGAGFNINPNYGFGVVDAAAAVTLAKTWTNVAAEKTYTTPLVSPNIAIPDNNTSGVSSSYSVSSSGIATVEFVEVTFSAADHTYSGDLVVTLTSPMGTASVLAEAHACEGNICTPYSGWVFGSAHFLGEQANGIWTLTVKDLGAADTGTFQSWKLKFYGI